jgi:pSer/pThr/pTyr-binding forkhead associated (FHA) protein
MAKLLRRIGGMTVQEFDLHEGTQRIGRAADNDIQLPDSTVSSFHAEITVTPGSGPEDMEHILLTDCRSKNGVYINGRSKQEHQLADGDRIKIGKQQFKFIAHDRIPVEEGDTVTQME